MNVKIIAEAIPETVSNQIVTSDYIVNSISDADKFINHVCHISRQGNEEADIR